MALTSTDFMAAPGLYGEGNQNDKLDVSDVLAAILLKDTATLGQISMKGTVHNIEHFWLEDALNACVFSGFNSASTDSGSFALLTGASAMTAAKFHKILRAGAILRHEDADVNFKVTAMGLSTSCSIEPYGSMTTCTSLYTVTQMSASNTASAYLRWFVVGQPKADTATYSDDISNARARRKNYTQVFERGIHIAETREHIALYAVSDELKHQIKMRTYEAKRELNNAVINSGVYMSAGASPDLETRTMSGIIQQIRDPDLDGTKEDTTVINASGGALTMTRISDLCKLMYDNGGFDDQANCCLIVGPYQARVIALIEENRIRKSSKELVVGSYANKVMTDLGFELDVIIDRWMPNGTVIVLDKSRATLMPLQGDAWHLEKMAKTSRVQGYQLSGQYTLELRNTDAAHGLIYGLAYS